MKRYFFLITGFFGGLILGACLLPILPFYMAKACFERNRSIIDVVLEV